MIFIWETGPRESLYIGGLEKGFLLCELISHNTSQFICTFRMTFFYKENKKSIPDHGPKGTNNFLIKNKIVDSAN